MPRNLRLTTIGSSFALVRLIKRYSIEIIKKKAPNEGLFNGFMDSLEKKGLTKRFNGAPSGVARHNAQIFLNAQKLVVFRQSV